MRKTIAFLMIMAFIGVVMGYSVNQPVGTKITIVNGTNVTHNDLQGIQGGSATERYHLSLAQTAFLYNMTSAGSAYNYNETSLIISLFNPNISYNHTSIVNTLYGKWFYNASDGSYNSTYAQYAYNETGVANTYTNTQILANSTYLYHNQTLATLTLINPNISYNHTLYANTTIYNAYGKFFYNMSDGIGGDYNYNETTLLVNTYGSFWGQNYTTITNATIYGVYGIWWYNMTTPFTTWLAGFTYNYNQTYTGGTYNSSYHAGLPFFYNMSDGSGGDYNYNETNVIITAINPNISYNYTSIILNGQNNWVKNQTFQNITINNYTTSRTDIYDNDTCLIFRRQSGSELAICD